MNNKNNERVYKMSFAGVYPQYLPKTNWNRLSPKEIRIWRDKIAKLEADSKAEIIN